MQSSDQFAGFADAHGRLTLGTIVMWCDELVDDDEVGDGLVAPTKALWAVSLRGCKELVGLSAFTFVDSLYDELSL